MIREGSCSGSTDWKVKAKTDDGRLEFEGEIDSNRNGQTWSWKIKHNGTVSARGTSTTRGPSGSFEVERRLTNLSGTDQLVFKAKNPATARSARGRWPSERPPAPGYAEPPDRGPRGARPLTVLRNPVVLFLVAGACVLAGIVVASDLFVRAAAEREAINDARSTTLLLARSVAQPALPPGWSTGTPGAVDRLDRQVLDRLLVGDVLRIKIWNRDGDVVYSDATELIGNQYALGEDELEVARGRRRRRRGLRPGRAGEPLRARPRRRRRGLHPDLVARRGSRCCSRPTTPTPTSTARAPRCSHRSGGSRWGPCSRWCCSPAR